MSGVSTSTISRHQLRLVHPAVDDDFVICRNVPYGQVLELPSRRLVHLAFVDDFVIC